MEEELTMEKSESIGAIAKALAAAQSEMTPAVFDSVNPHFRSRYASLASVVAAGRVLAKHGIAIIQDASGSAGQEVVISTTLAHESGEWLRGTVTLRAEKATPQGVGSTITYGRRYGIALMAGVVSDDDDDGNSASEQSKAGLASLSQQPKPVAPPVTPPPPISDEERAKRVELADALKVRWSESQATRATVIAALRGASSKVGQALGAIPMLDEKRIDLLGIHSEILGAALAGEEQPA